MKSSRIKNIVGFGIATIAGFIVAPAIYVAIQGLIGLAIAAVVGLAIASFAPWVAMKFANWKVAAIEHEASENPIETMRNLLIQREVAYKEFEQSVVTAITARKNFSNQCDEFANKFPDRAPEFYAQLENMTGLVERKKEALAAAKVQLGLGHSKLQEMEAYWKMSQAAQEANAAAGMDTGDLFEKLKEDTAANAVFESINRAFAQLEMESSVNTQTPCVTVTARSQPAIAQSYTTNAANNSNAKSVSKSTLFSTLND